MFYLGQQVAIFKKHFQFSGVMARKQPKRNRQARSWGREEEPKKPGWARRHLTHIAAPTAAVGTAIFLWYIAGSSDDAHAPPERIERAAALPAAAKNGSYADMERMYQLARRNESLRGDFVQRVARTIQVPEYVDDIFLAGPEAAINEPNTAMRTIPNAAPTLLGEKITCVNSRIGIYPRAFALNGNMPKYSDFLSALVEHEFLHAKTYHLGGDHLVRHCVTNRGTFAVNLYEILGELDCYGAQIRKHIQVVGNHMEVRGISEDYARNVVLVEYHQNFVRVERLRNWDAMKPGNMDSLIRRYTIPHLRFAQTNGN